MATNDNTDRVNVGRIDHISFVYRTRENQEKARQHFSVLFGVDDWDDLGETDYGIHIYISWKSGIELVAPFRPGSVVEDHLAKHGEGLWTLVMGVSNLDEAMAHAARSGYRPVVLPPVPEGVASRFEVAKEGLIGDIAGAVLVYGEFRPKVELE